VAVTTTTKIENQMKTQIVLHSFEALSFVVFPAGARAGINAGASSPKTASESAPRQEMPPKRLMPIADKIWRGPMAMPANGVSQTSGNPPAARQLNKKIQEQPL
jgi:hypothetical protein